MRSVLLLVSPFALVKRFNISAREAFYRGLETVHAQGGGSSTSGGIAAVRARFDLGQMRPAGHRASQLVEFTSHE